MINTKLSVVTILAIVAVLLLSGCSNKGADKVKNPALKGEIFRLNHEMEGRILTEADTVNIVALSKDPVEIYYAKGFAWLVKNNEQEHLNHPLTFLDWYVRHGEDNFCAPHELGHIAAYIEKGDIPFAEETFAVVKQKMHLWDERQEINRQTYPQYYEGLGELKELMNKAMGMLGNKDYGEETVKLLEEIDEKSIC